MSLLMVLTVAFKALARNKMRTALTMLGMIIGVSAVITMVALGTGAQSSVETQIQAAGTNMIMVSAGNFQQGGVRMGQGNASTLTPEDALAAYAGDPGAEVYRACVACHTLSADEGNRAGPTLAGIFGRKIATLPGYNFSDALKKLDIVWTPETVAKLFEIGPMAYTPGTKMPEQRIGSEQDRKALTDFLSKATK